MEEIERRAPKDGYDNEPKMKYRHEVWSRLSEKAKPILESNENAKVLMLPSKEGIEIDVAMEYGIKPEQIIAIDENGALLAHAKWKHKIPKSNRFGQKVSNIGKKIKENGWVLAAANLDFCNNFSDELLYELQNFIEATPLTDTSYISTTLMKGRETKALLKLIRKIGIQQRFKEERLTTLFECLDLNDATISVLFEDSYFESSPMIYGIISIKSNNIRLLSQAFPKEVEDKLTNKFNLFFDKRNTDLGIAITKKDARFNCEDPPHEGSSWVYKSEHQNIEKMQDKVDSVHFMAPVGVINRTEAELWYKSVNKIDTYHTYPVVSYNHDKYNYLLQFNYHAGCFLASRYPVGGSLTYDSTYCVIEKSLFMQFIRNIDENGVPLFLKEVFIKEGKYFKWHKTFPYKK